MERRPKRHPDTAYRAVGEEGGLVVLPKQAQVKVLNPVGTKVYALLDGRHTIEQIVDEVVREFDVSVETARRDVIDFIDELAANHMLASDEETEGSPTP